MEYRSWRTGIQIDNIYPIGSIYMSVNNIDPGTLFGGAWERIKDTFLLCAGDSYNGGSTGGNINHTHQQVAVTSGGPSNNTSGSTAITVAQMPSHNHGGSTTRGYASFTRIVHGHGSGTDASHMTGWDGSYGYHDITDSTANGLNHYHNINAQGSGSGHTHTLSSHTHSISATNTGSASSMPPYLAVYVWQRVS